MTTTTTTTTTAPRFPQDPEGDDDKASLLSPCPIDPAVVDSTFCCATGDADAKTSSSLPIKSLRVTCYGSSSSKTPERYLNEARSLGYILAKRGHVCVNGAGSHGCMAAMNDGCLVGDGHMVGVIHGMFMVDGEDGGGGHGGGGHDDEGNNKGTKKKAIRDGGAHRAFARNSRATTSTRRRDGNATAAAHDQHQHQHHDHGGPIREILVAGGDDLQERKKLLVRDSDGLVVLPGGPGTWDELWEMACARHLDLHQLPIVCVNVDGFYDPFRAMLDRAYDDELIRLPPHEIVHFAPTAEAAVRYIEGERIEGEGDHVAAAAAAAGTRHSLKSRKSFFQQRSSFFSAWPYQSRQQDNGSSRSRSFLSTATDDDDYYDGGSSEEEDGSSSWSPYFYLTLAFAAGSALGVATAAAIFFAATTTNRGKPR